jgi:virulence-associated protein VagC
MAPDVDMASEGKDSQAVRLLSALRAAGSHVYILPEEDGDGDLLVVSPPARHVDWPGDAEEAVEDLCDALRALVLAEDAGPIH